MPPIRANIAQLDFRAGIVRDMAPQAIDPRACYDILNGLLDEDASIYKRGGTVNKSDAAFGSSGIRFLDDRHYDAGQRTLFANPSDFGVLDADDEGVVNLGNDGLSAPVGTAYIESLLFIGGGYIYGGSRKTASYSTTGGNTHVTINSKVVTDASGGFTANVDPGMLFQAGSTARVYVVESVDSDTQVTLRDAYEGSTSTTLDSTFWPVYKITSTDPYRDADIYAVCANRLCTLEGDTLYFSQMPNTTTGAPNPHDFDATDYYRLPGGVQGIGLGVSGSALVVFTSGGAWVYEGLAYELVDSQGTGQHRARLLSTDIILVNQAGLCSYQQALIAPCIDGIYLMDGVSAPRRISRPIDSLYRSYIQRGYSMGVSAVYRGHFLLPVMSNAGTDTRDLLVARLDYPLEVGGQRSFPWVRINGAGGEISGFVVRRGGAVEEPLLLAAESQATSRVVDASGYFEPTADNKYDADGTAFTWMLVTRDYETGGLTENMVRGIRTRAELTDADADDPEIIFDYGFGLRAGAGDSVWDVNYWDDLDADDADSDLLWGDDDDDTYYPLADCSLTENLGIDPHTCHVNKRARFIRFRLRNLEPCASLRLRSLEVQIRPSEAVRR